MPQLKSRATVVIAAVVALVTAVVLTVVLSSSGESSGDGRGEGPLASPAFTADTVPVSQALKGRDCGLSKATIEGLVPSAEKIGDHCEWYRYERGLDVDVDGAGTPLAVTSSADALFALSPRPPKLFTGLGDDEALARTWSPHGNAQTQVALTVRGTPIQVLYSGDELSEEKTQAGALKAAAEIAKSLGTPAKPALSGVTPVGGAAPGLTALPRVCDSVPDDALDKLVRGARRSRGEATRMLTQVRGAATDTCEWDVSGPYGAKVERKRVLRVTIGSVPDWAPGAGAHAVTRAYLTMHREARGDGSANTGAAGRFHALKGLGDQAFGGAWSKDEQYGRVVFRFRNVLVDVQYRGEDTESKTRYATDLPGDKALVGAYTAALGIASSLKSSKDAVPLAGPITQRFPRGCGLSAATLRSIAPKAEVSENGDFGNCGWYLRGPNQSLDVSLRTFLTSGPDATQPAGLSLLSTSGPANELVRASPLSSAARDVGRMPYSKGEPEPVTGVGEEAIGGFHPDGGTAWTQFRVGGVVAHVSYGAGVARPVKRGEEARLREAVLKASAEIARSLGAAPQGTPAYVSQGNSGTPLALPSSACGLVSGKVLDKVIKGHEPPDSSADAPPEGMLAKARRAACTWVSNDRMLMVTVVSAPGSYRAAAQQTAARVYLAAQLDAQADQPISRDDEKYFRTLTGLGDQAFASYTEEGVPGRIMMRRGNLLLEIIFLGYGRGKPPNRKKSIDVVSAVAAGAAAKLPR